MTSRLATLGLAALVSFSVHAANELKIGFLSTLSGPAGGIGIEIRDGFNLAVKLAGGKLGGLPTEVIFADDTLNPDTGKQLAERLLRRDRVNLMTGVVFSNVMLAVWPTIEEAKVFYVAPNATPTSITGKGCSPYFFSTSWPNEAHHEAAGAFAQSKGFKNAYLIAPNYPAGKDALTGFKRTYKGQIVAEQYVKLNQLDYSAELAQIRAAKADALYAFLPAAWASTSSSSSSPRDSRTRYSSSCRASFPTRTSCAPSATRCSACSTPCTGPTTWRTTPTKSSSPSSKSSPISQRKPAWRAIFSRSMRRSST